MEEILATKRRMKKLLYLVVVVNVFVIISIFVCGCSAGFGVGVDGSVFWPEVETSEGGKFGDPAESRKQTTQHTIGSASHNLPMVGGGE